MPAVRSGLVGLVLAGLVVLTGCAASSGDAPHGCPSLSHGVKVKAQTFAKCVAAASAHTKGYASKITFAGQSFVERVNEKTNATEVDSGSNSMMIVGGKGYVRVGHGPWRKPDLDSDDPVVQLLSAFVTQASNTDPARSAKRLPGTLTVTGESARHGQHLYVVTGKAPQVDAAATVRYEVTPGYVVRYSRSTTGTGGGKALVVPDVLQWNVAERITPPSG